MYIIKHCDEITLVSVIVVLLEFPFKKAHKHRLCKNKAKAQLPYKVIKNRNMNLFSDI